MLRTGFTTKQEDRFNNFVDYAAQKKRQTGLGFGSGLRRLFRLLVFRFEISEGAKGGTPDMETKEEKKRRRKKRIKRGKKGGETPACFVHA